MAKGDPDNKKFGRHVAQELPCSQCETMFLRPSGSKTTICVTCATGNNAMKRIPPPKPKEGPK